MNSNKSARSAIELLLKVLSENGTVKLRAETFRLAKFNQNDAAEPLWHLLFELLYFCKFDRIEDISVRAWMEMTKEEIVVYVRHELQRLGFLSADLAALPRDMSSGSRELLLATGWLLCKHNIVQRFMINCTAPLEQDTAHIHQGKVVNTVEKLLPASKDLVERVRQLVWFNNKLQMNLRILLALLTDSAKLKHKIYEATYGCSSDPDKKHLSMFEVYLLRHPDLLKKNLELLEKDNERLQHFISWIEMEDVFWKWMESVLDEKQKERQSTGETNVTADHVMNMSHDTWLRAQRSHIDLQDAIIKYEIIVENLERLWESKATDVSEEELDSVLSAIDLELSIQRSNIELSRDYQKPDHQTTPTFVYERGEGIKTNVATTSNGTESLRHIQEEIKELERRAKQLEDELENKQSNLCHQLLPLSARFKHAVCIPPMA